MSIDAKDVKQRTLDAGQRNVGGQYCKQCDMMYTIESIAEVEMHDKHHNRYTDVAAVRISSSQLNLWLRRECNYPVSRGSIFRIVPDSRSSLKRKTEQLIEDIVNPSVGFSPDLSIWGWDARRTVWVSIITESLTHCIAGIVVAEPLLSAQCSDTLETVRDDDPIIGVNRIWTHPSARRKGIASELLDVIRKRYFTGVLVPRHRVAFSDPTDSGKRFALRYLREDGDEKHSLLVYSVTK